MNVISDSSDVEYEEEAGGVVDLNDSLSSTSTTVTALARNARQELDKRTRATTKKQKGNITLYVNSKALNFAILLTLFC